MQPNRFSSRSLERILLTAGACWVLALGCAPTMEIQGVIQAKSCTDEAHTMQFEMKTNSPIANVGFIGGTPNVKSIPVIYSDNNTHHVYVVADLDNVMRNEKVTVKFNSHVHITNSLTVSLSNVSFFKAPWFQYPDVPDCAVVQSPQFTITIPPGGSTPASSPPSLSLQVANPAPLPMTLVALELAEAPVLLDASALDWDDPSFNALPWQSAAPAGIMLDMAAPPIVVDLPGTAGGQALLCRFISMYDGMEVRGIMQADLTGSPLRAKRSTWGEVKALYRN